MCESLALENYPSNVESNEFRYLIQSLLFSKEYYDFKEKTRGEHILY